MSETRRRGRPQKPRKGMGERISEVRNGLGLTMRQAAERWGIDRGALYHYEAGDRQPRIDFIISVAKTEGIRADWLLGLCEEKNA